MLWHQVSGNATMSRKVSFANFSVVAANLSTPPVEDDSEVKSTFYSAVILQLPSLSFCNTSTKLLQEVFILLVRDPLQLVLPCMSQRTSRPKKSSSKVVLWFYLIEVFAALMSSTKWMITPELFFMRPWSSRLFPSPRLVSFAPSMQEPQSWQLQIQSSLNTIQACRLLKMWRCHQPSSQDSTWFTLFSISNLRQPIEDSRITSCLSTQISQTAAMKENQLNRLNFWSRTPLPGNSLLSIFLTRESVSLPSSPIPSRATSFKSTFKWEPSVTPLILSQRLPVNLNLWSEFRKHSPKWDSQMWLKREMWTRLSHLLETLFNNLLLIQLQVRSIWILLPQGKQRRLQRDSAQSPTILGASM